MDVLLDLWKCKKILEIKGAGEFQTNTSKEPACTKINRKLCLLLFGANIFCFQIYDFCGE
jgi:hypothetical protein